MKGTTYSNYRYRSVVCDKIEWRSYWLTTQRFFRLTYRPLHEMLRRQEYATENKNIHTLFRKNFELKRKSQVKRALAYVTGDDMYKLYLNGEFVGEGPSQSYPSCYNYNCFDVTDLVKSDGINAVGIHVYYQGYYNIYLISADNLCGMVFQLEVEYTDGSKEVIGSDRSWKCRELDAYSFSHIFGYCTQLSEDIDMRLLDKGWLDAEHDLSAWDKVCVPGTFSPEHYSFVPQITPAVRHEVIYPAQTLKIDDGYFIDFGKEWSGAVGFNIRGDAGETVEVRCGEELDENGRVRFKLRANCCYSETVTLSGEDDTVDFFDYKGFRYVEILTSRKLGDGDVWMLTRNYPFPEDHAVLESSDKLLCDIWEICRQGVKIGTQDTYFDCPTREKGGFLGDALITGLSHLIFTGDTRIYKKFIRDCAANARIFPGIVAHVPTNIISTLLDYSALFPLFLEDYYTYTGDIDFLREMLPILDGVIDYYTIFENENKLLENIQQPIEGLSHNPAILVDWPPELRDGYEFDAAEKGVSSVANMFWYGCIKKASMLYAASGDTERSAELEEKYKVLEKAIIDKLYDSNVGLFKDTPESAHCGLHSNTLALFYGLEVPGGYEPLVNKIMERRLHCGVYFAYFVIRGLYNIERPDEAYDLITGKDIHTWYNMLKCGATTCMEAWGPDQKWNTSWCHPWSSSPVYFLVMEILGVKPAGPGWSVIKCSPKIPDELDSLSVDMPIPCGRVRASFERVGGEVVYRISAPDGCEVVFDDGGKAVKFEVIK
nr:family 78 glycoside hydrolase catalytic domain [Clostridia bacterium]